jgi:hypothetical protein
VLAAQEAYKSAHALRDAEERVHALARAAAEEEAARLNRDLPPQEPVEFKNKLPEYRTRLGDLRGGHSFRVEASSVSFVEVRGAQFLTAPAPWRVPGGHPSLIEFDQPYPFTRRLSINGRVCVCRYTPHRDAVREVVPGPDGTHDQ